MEDILASTSSLGVLNTGRASKTFDQSSFTLQNQGFRDWLLRLVEPSRCDIGENQPNPWFCPRKRPIATTISALFQFRVRLNVNLVQKTSKIVSTFTFSRMRRPFYDPLLRLVECSSHLPIHFCRLIYLINWFLIHFLQPCSWRGCFAWKLIISAIAGVISFIPLDVCLCI